MTRRPSAIDAATEPDTREKALNGVDASAVAAPSFIARMRGMIEGGGLRRAAMRGSALTLVGYGGAQVLRLASNLILTRLLFPEAFGLMALVNVFMQGLQMFSDLGIGPSIIQSKRGDDPSFLNTAWTIQIIRGALLCVVGCLLAAPVAAFYGEPMLAQLLPVAALAAFIAGFQCTAIFTANRHLQLGRLTVVYFVAQVMGTLSMIIWAAYVPTVWALVGGNLFSSLTLVVLSFRLLPTHGHRIAFDRGAFRELFSFGCWIFLSTALLFLGSSFDRLALGQLVSLAELGLYGIALNLSRLPRDTVGMLADRVLFPLLSRARDDPARLRYAMRRLFQALAFGGIPLFCCASVGIHLFILLALDDRYAAAAPIASMLVLAMWGGFFEHVAASVALSNGRANRVAYLRGWRLVFQVIGILGGFHFGGLNGLLVGFAIAGVCGGAVGAQLSMSWPKAVIATFVLLVGAAALVVAHTTAVFLGSYLFE